MDIYLCVRKRKIKSVGGEASYLSTKVRGTDQAVDGIGRIVPRCELIGPSRGGRESGRRVIHGSWAEPGGASGAGPRVGDAIFGLPSLVSGEDDSNRREREGTDVSSNHHRYGEVAVDESMVAGCGVELFIQAEAERPESAERTRATAMIAPQGMEYTVSMRLHV